MAPSSPALDRKRGECCFARAMLCTNDKTDQHTWINTSAELLNLNGHPLLWLSAATLSVQQWRLKCRLVATRRPQLRRPIKLTLPWYKLQHPLILSNLRALPFECAGQELRAFLSCTHRKLGEGSLPWRAEPHGSFPQGCRRSDVGNRLLLLRE